MAVKPFVFYTDKLNFKSTKGTDGERYFVEGHISTGDIDLVNDIVTKNCMDSMFSQFDERNIKLDFEHETLKGKSKLDSEVSKTRIPLGKAINRHMDEKGLVVEWELNDTWNKFDEKGNVTMSFKDVWKNIEGKYLDAFSIAYVPTETSEREVNGTKARLLNNLNLLNVALTGNPVNPGASMVNIMKKSLDSISKKGYDKDGAHAHTEENPIGNHNHPEIEKEITQEISWVNDRINNLSERVYSFENNIEKENSENSININSKSGENMADEKKPEEKPKGEKKSKSENDVDMIEVKSTISALKKELAEMKDMSTQMAEIKSGIDEMKELKAEIKSVLELARPKGTGAQSKSRDSQTEEITSLGQLL